MFIISAIISVDALSKAALIILIVGGLPALFLSNYVLEKYNDSKTSVSWFARWAGIISVVDISIFIAMILIGLTGKVKAVERVEVTRHSLTGVSYIILAVVFLIMIGGLGWCFYRALTAAGGKVEPQAADEIGD